MARKWNEIVKSSINNDLHGLTIDAAIKWLESLKSELVMGQRIVIEERNTEFSDAYHLYAVTQQLETVEEAKVREAFETQQRNLSKEVRRKQLIEQLERLEQEN